VQALLEGNRYFIKQVDVVQLQSPASNSVVPEMRLLVGTFFLCFINLWKNLKFLAYCFCSDLGLVTI